MTATLNYTENGSKKVKTKFLANFLCNLFDKQILKHFIQQNLNSSLLIKSLNEKHEKFAFNTNIFKFEKSKQLKTKETDFSSEIHLTFLSLKPNYFESKQFFFLKKLLFNKKYSNVTVFWFT